MLATTIQGSDAFFAAAYTWLAERGDEYWLGCDATGVPVADGGRRALIDTTIFDEAHHLSGRFDAKYNNALNVGLQMSCRSLSLTATPKVLKARRDATVRRHAKRTAEAAAAAEAAAEAAREDGVPSVSDSDADADDLCPLVTDSDSDSDPEWGEEETREPTPDTPGE